MAGQWRGALPATSLTSPATQLTFARKYRRRKGRPSYHGTITCRDLDTARDSASRMSVDNDSSDESPPNTVAALREKANLSRIRLAKLADVTVAAVRRMEHGGTVRIDDAIRVATALREAPERVFDRGFRVLQRRGLELNRALADLAWNDDDLRDEMNKAGLDVHPAEWTLKVHFIGGEVRVWKIFSADLDRFWRNLDEEQKLQPRFFSFDSDERSIAFNLSQMAHAHALFDAAAPPTKEVDDGPGVEVLLAGEREWLSFGAEFDEPADDGPGSYRGQLNELLSELEMAQYGEPYIKFDDEDGECAVFRVSALAAVSVSQELLWGADDGLDEEAEPPPRPPVLSRRRRLKIVPDAP